MKKRDLALLVAGAAGAAVAVKMLTRPGGVDWDTVAESVPHSDRSEFINVDGAAVHYQSFGDPTHPTMILIHGFTASVYVWHTVAPELAERGFHVIALDLLGFGYSDKPHWFDYTIESQARMISRFMDLLGIGQAIVVGSSYGGAVAATIALDYPARVDKLVLVDAVINDDAKQNLLLRTVAIPGVGEVLAPFLIDSKAFLKYRMRRTLAPANYDLITDERTENIRRPISAADAHHSVLATSRNWHAKRIEQDAHLIRQPTLLVWGEDDKVIPVEHGLRLYDSVLQSRLVVFKNCGHVPQEEKSELFVELVSEFAHDRKGRIEEREAEKMSLKR